MKGGEAKDLPDFVSVAPFSKAKVSSNWVQVVSAYVEEVVKEEPVKNKVAKKKTVKKAEKKVEEPALSKMEKAMKDAENYMSTQD